MLFTLLIEIYFFCLISLCISTIFKSNVGAVAVSILVFFLTIALNPLAVNNPILRFLPFTNINLFKYLGSSFLTNYSTAGIFENLLTPTVFIGANFWLSFILLFATLIFIIYITFLIFRKRDIK